MRGLFAVLGNVRKQERPLTLARAIKDRNLSVVVLCETNVKSKNAPLIRRLSSVERDDGAHGW